MIGWVYCVSVRMARLIAGLTLSIVVEEKKACNVGRI